MALATGGPGREVNLAQTAADAQRRDSPILKSRTVPASSRICSARRQHQPRTARQRYQRHGSQRYPDLSPGSYSTPDARDCGT